MGIIFLALLMLYIFNYVISPSMLDKLEVIKFNIFDHKIHKYRPIFWDRIVIPDSIIKYKIWVCLAYLKRYIQYVLIETCKCWVAQDATTHNKTLFTPVWHHDVFPCFAGFTPFLCVQASLVRAQTSEGPYLWPTSVASNGVWGRKQQMVHIP